MKRFIGFQNDLHSNEALTSFREEMNHLLATDELDPGEFRQWTKRKDLTISKTPVRVRQLDWRHPSQLPISDVILAADVVYAIHLFVDLVKLLKQVSFINNYFI